MSWGQCLRIHEGKQRLQWFSHECDALVECFVANVSVRSFAFCPEVAVEAFPELSEQEDAAVLYAQVSQEHVLLISKAMSTAFALELSQMPESCYLGFEGEIRQSFLLANYLTSVRPVISAPLSKLFVFAPEVHACELHNKSDQQDAASFFVQSTTAPSGAFAS